ncbi:MarR family winged helix-turn-helix transcriptional regulator [Subtercola sp. YIM 133946]|uniref:MarR family winged helix-turn-helix transcriptional regulator n=1 Tax=Subtercola sp. YIM 133946 TaxID=3118909 RepID=UPI002F930118
MHPYATFFSEIVRLEIDLWNQLDGALKADGHLGVAHLQALRSIADRAGGARVQDVSDDLQITVGAASKLVDRLERDGLAVRNAHPFDRRSMVVALTPSGSETFHAAAASAAGHVEQMLGDGLSETRATELAETLSTIRRSLRAEGLAS